jgi:hypothetical protein
MHWLLPYSIYKSLFKSHSLNHYLYIIICIKIVLYIFSLSNSFPISFHSLTTSFGFIHFRLLYLASKKSEIEDGYI